MQQFGAATFNTVVHWHELGKVLGKVIRLGKVDNECISHNSIICVPKIIKYDENLIKWWQKQFWLFSFIVTWCIGQQCE